MLEDDFKVKLREFPIHEIEHNSVCVFLGKRRSGKSFLLRNLMYNHKDIPVGTCISGTESASPFFRNFLPKPFIHFRINPSIIANSMKRQKLIKKRLLKEKDLEVRDKIDPRAFLILDDCLYDKSWTKDETIREIFMNGRHFDLMFVVTMQYPMGIPPELRANVDYAFIFREPSINNRKRIYENYASCIPTFKLFNRIMDMCTENYECVVIKTLATTNKIQDQVFYYKAPAVEDFRVGYERFWNYKPDSSDDDDDDDEFCSSEQISKKGQDIRIKKKHSRK